MVVAKVSVESTDNKSPEQLFEFDKAKELEYVIQDCCQALNLPKSSVYALKIISTKENNSVNCYVTKENFASIRDGDKLRLVYSIDYYITTIFKLIDSPVRDQSFLDLKTMSIDNDFINKLAETKKHLDILQIFVDQNLTTSELESCLLCILNLLKNGQITSTTPNFLHKILCLVLNEGTNITCMKSILSILQKILCSKNEVFNLWKEQIIKDVPLRSIFPFIWTVEKKELRSRALFLINTIIRNCKGEPRQHLIKEINLRQNRSYIYQHIIEKGNVDKEMEHQLYVYQTFLLSLFGEALNSSISLKDNKLFSPEEFELAREEEGSSAFMDFQDDLALNETMSVENLPLRISSSARFSLNSMTSVSEKRSSCDRSSFKSRQSDYIDPDNMSISYLTYEAMRKYKDLHKTNFYQSQVEEKAYKPGIFITSERITRILAKLLHIGKEPDKESTTYQPLVFNCSSKTPFFMELFSRAMWLLSKTRREMKAFTLVDFNKALRVVKEQIKMILAKKPMTLNVLTEKMNEVSFQTILDHWETQRQNNMNLLLKEHRCIQELQNQYRIDSAKLIFQQRMNYLKKGNTFKKVLEDNCKKYSTIKFQEPTKLSLLGNEKHILMRQYNIKKQTQGSDEFINIEDISYLVEGKNCKHANLVDNPEKIFTIILKDSKFRFIADNEQVAAYWKEGLTMLMSGKRQIKTKFYHSELEELTRMEVLLQLVELQNVQIPKEPPQIPPPPSCLPTPPKDQLPVRKTSRSNHN